MQNVQSLPDALDQGKVSFLILQWTTRGEKLFLKNNITDSILITPKEIILRTEIS